LDGFALNFSVGPKITRQSKNKNVSIFLN